MPSRTKASGIRALTISIISSMAVVSSGSCRGSSGDCPPIRIGTNGNTRNRKPRLLLFAHVIVFGSSSLYKVDCFQGFVILQIPNQDLGSICPYQQACRRWLLRIFGCSWNDLYRGHCHVPLLIVFILLMAIIQWIAVHCLPCRNLHSMDCIALFVQ